MKVSQLNEVFMASLLALTHGSEIYCTRRANLANSAFVIKCLASYGLWIIQGGCNKLFNVSRK